MKMVHGGGICYKNGMNNQGTTGDSNGAIAGLLMRFGHFLAGTPEDGMSWTAKLYCAVVIVGGGAVLFDTLRHLNTGDAVRLAVYILCAAVLATTRLRVPGLTATVSGACIVIFTGVAGLTLGETVLIGIATGIAQCLWKPQHPPRAVQVVFSIATLIISSAITYRCYHLLSGIHPFHMPTILIVSEAGIYFATNTALIAGVLAVTEVRPPIQVWRQLYLWTLPHYIIFAMIGAFINDASAGMNWIICLAAMPAILYLNHARVSRAEMQRA